MPEWHQTPSVGSGPSWQVEGSQSAAQVRDSVEGFGAQATDGLRRRGDRGPECMHDRREHTGMDVSGGIGALAGKILRIGIMGPLATDERVDALLEALAASM